jgi:hypothetical protein
VRRFKRFVGPSSSRVRGYTTRPSAHSKGVNYLLVSHSQITGHVLTSHSQIQRGVRELRTPCSRQVSQANRIFHFGIFYEEIEAVVWCVRKSCCMKYFFEKRGVCIRELKSVEFALFVEFEA